MISVSDIFRHPVKSHGREALSAVTLAAGKTMPWDRVWAVAHDMAKFFTHPALDPLTINPDLRDDSAKLVAWTKPIMPADRAASHRIVRAPDRGMTDTPFPSISINSQRCRPMG